jgi:hypothetical protein
MSERTVDCGKGDKSVLPSRFRLRTIILIIALLAVLFAAVRIWVGSVGLAGVSLELAGSNVTILLHFLLPRPVLPTPSGGAQIFIPDAYVRIPLSIVVFAALGVALLGLAGRYLIRRRGKVPGQADRPNSNEENNRSGEAEGV